MVRCADVRWGSRGFVVADLLEPAIGPDGAVATGLDESALRAGQGDFEATGKIPCAQSQGQPMGLCDFGVARHGGSYATVVVTGPDRHGRALYFKRGVAIGADTAQADGYPDFTAEKAGDLHRISVGTERYEIPDAVVLGG
jgi:hypothetical protein